jgi:hypothetical protein
MSLSQLLPTVNQLSHQDKLRLIHFLLLAVAKEEGCSPEPTREPDRENVLQILMLSFCQFNGRSRTRTDMRGYLATF